MPLGNGELAKGFKQRRDGFALNILWLQGGGTVRWERL